MKDYAIYIDNLVWYPIRQKCINEKHGHQCRSTSKNLIRFCLCVCNQGAYADNLADAVDRLLRMCCSFYPQLLMLYCHPTHCLSIPMGCGSSALHAIAWYHASVNKEVQEMSLDSSLKWMEILPCNTSSNIHHIIVKVAPLVHVKKLTYLLPFITIKTYFTIAKMIHEKMTWSKALWAIVIKGRRYVNLWTCTSGSTLTIMWWIFGDLPNLDIIFDFL